MNALHNFNFFLFEYANLCEQIDHLLMTALSPILNAPEGKLKSRFFTLKNHQMFSVYTTPEKFKSAITTGHFGFEKISDHPD